MTCWLANVRMQAGTGTPVEMHTRGAVLPAPEVRAMSAPCLLHGQQMPTSSMQGNGRRGMREQQPQSSSQPKLPAFCQQSLLQSWFKQQPASASAPAGATIGPKGTDSEDKASTGRKRKLPESFTAAQEQGPSSNLPALDLCRVRILEKTILPSAVMRSHRGGSDLHSSCDCANASNPPRVELPNGMECRQRSPMRLFHLRQSTCARVLSPQA